MMKRTLAVAGLATALFGAAPRPVDAAPAARPVSEILVDAEDGSVLYARNAEIRRRPASLTKMMTLFLTFDAIDSGRLKLSDTIPVSRYAASQKPSRLGARAGSRLTVDQAIRAVAVISANDIAVALAEAVGGSEDRFARMMTAKAKELGLKDTSFTNVTGMPGANLTTAHDIARLSLALLHDHPARYALFSTRAFEWQGRRVANHNHLLGAFNGADGIKTGYTAEAGFALAASAKRQGRRLVAVVIGERSIQLRDRRVAQLLDDGFARAQFTPEDAPAVAATAPRPRGPQPRQPGGNLASLVLGPPETE